MNIVLDNIAKQLEQSLPQDLQEFDKQLEQLVRDQAGARLDRFFAFFSLLGKQPTVFAMSLATVAILVRRKQYYYSGLVLLAVMGGLLLNNLVKYLVKRSRPRTLNTLLHHSRTYSFPSAHTNLSVCYY